MKHVPPDMVIVLAPKPKLVERSGFARGYYWLLLTILS